MCRFTLYLGPPVRLSTLLIEPEHSLSVCLANLDGPVLVVAVLNRERDACDWLPRINVNGPENEFPGFRHTDRPCQRDQ